MSSPSPMGHNNDRIEIECIFVLRQTNDQRSLDGISWIDIGGVISRVKRYSVSVESCADGYYPIRLIKQFTLLIEFQEDVDNNYSSNRNRPAFGIDSYGIPYCATTDVTTTCVSMKVAYVAAINMTPVVAMSDGKSCDRKNKKLDPAGNTTAWRSLSKPRTF